MAETLANAFADAASSRAMARYDDIHEVARFLAEEHGSCAHALAARIGEIQQRRDNPQGVAFWAEVETRIDKILVSPQAV